MENASKALLIAAGVLIAVLLTTLGIKVASSSKGAVGQSEEIGGTILSTSKDATGKLSGLLGIKGEASHDAFIWESDDPNSPGYGVVIGYTQKAETYTVLRFPERCTKIDFGWDSAKFAEAGITGAQHEAESTSRSFINNIKKIEIPSSVSSIGYGSFFRCTGLTNVTIPNSVIHIGYMAFEGCTSLTSINIPNSVITIENNAFNGCTSLTSINIPNSVTTIGNNAFSGCTSLTSINIPNSVTSIGNSAFSGCTSLTSIDIPNSVTSIANSLFYKCTSLTNVTILNRGETNIGVSPFGSCNNLKKVKIMSSELAFIGGGQFSQMALVSKIYVLNETIRDSLKGKYIDEKTTVEVVTEEDMKNK